MCLQKLAVASSDMSRISIYFMDFRRNIAFTAMVMVIYENNTPDSQHHMAMKK